MEIINGSSSASSTVGILSVTTNAGLGKTLVSDAQGVLGYINHNLAAHGAPGVSNDNTQGYAIASHWVNIDTTPHELYLCVNPATGAAQWNKVLYPSIVPVPQTTGFTIAGGTTNKTLTVAENATLDQNLATNATPTFSKINDLTIAKQSVGFTIAGGTSPATLTVSATATVAGNNSGDQDIPAAASGADVIAGTNTTKFVTAKALSDANILPTSGIAYSLKNYTESSSPVTLTTALCSGFNIFTNIGAQAEVIFNLPSGVSGCMVYGAITASYPMSFVAYNSQTISYLDVVSIAGGKITSTNLNDQITLRWNGLTWDATLVGFGWQIQTS